jgi:hypothetical protein
MDTRERIQAGAACPRCGIGTMTLASKTPNPLHPGFADVSFQCSECPDVAKQMQDNRFL